MYEYFPKEPKKRERLLLACLAVGAFSLYGISRIPAMPFPAIWQLLAVVLLGGVVVVLTQYLIRDFCYRIEMSEDGAVPDFTVTEYCGKRITVVCRISLNDIVELRPITDKEYKHLTRTQKGRRVYDYTCRIDPGNLYLLTARDKDELYDVRIVADERLAEYLSH